MMNSKRKSAKPYLNSKTRQLIKDVLTEDIGRGDLTTRAIISAQDKAIGTIIVKDSGIIAGLEVAQLVFRTVNRGESIKFKTKVKDGDKVKNGQIIVEMRGPAMPILTAERTALNFLQHLSGIATLTSKFVSAVNLYKAKITDTRKTTPGWRILEKYAVRKGGGLNHRMGLDDGILIKNNHHNIREGNIGQTVQLALRKAPLGMKVEVEVRNLKELKEACATEVNIIMLDNMTIGQIKRAVEFVNHIGKKVLLEASGGITLRNVRRIAATGVDLISVGALTHSAPILNMNLKIYGAS
ncbi:MAG: Nicotinate-nucleotide pyrophosphorylase (carboxylating) [Syntrophomonadaceae bacterium]|nr:Nicotinate-nucleotide pyrophosphorylase (carboxylating) [Bacillota bacterium]